MNHVPSAAMRMSISPQYGDFEDEPAPGHGRALAAAASARPPRAPSGAPPPATISRLFVGKNAVRVIRLVSGRRPLNLVRSPAKGNSPSPLA